MKEYLTKDNYHYIKLICIYTIILDIVYSVWTYKVDFPWWAILIVVVSILLLGGLVLFLYLKHLKKLHDNTSKEEVVSENTTEEGTNKVC